MTRPDKSKPMPVKHWSFAGLMLTYWCNARCASCYVCSGPDAGGEMDVDAGLAIWEGLQSASPHGCRVHIGGGEPFGRWERLIELARRAKAAGLGPLQAVETNAYWAADERTVRDRVAALGDAGLGRLAISADPYHQQFVPIERVRLAARVAEEVLGADRVRVRWRDWAADGFNTDAPGDAERRKVFSNWALRRRDRLNGRAAAALAGFFQLQPARAFADNPCADRLLRSRHVHVDGDGIICGGTCAGIALGRAAGADDVGRSWRHLSEVFSEQSDTIPPGLEIVAMLVAGGPVAMLAAAVQRGFEPAPAGYAAKCHLCWCVRRWLFENGFYRGQLAPAAVYRP
jgi:hypothetical protein